MVDPMRLLAALLPVAFAAAPATAADPEPWATERWNPAPADDDVVLGLPCGGAMAFRRVETAAPNNWLADERLALGNSEIAGQEHSESLIGDSIIGSLSLDGTPAGRFYLIGKYEVTAGQYAAVMESMCPTEDDDDTLPAEGMSWLDAQTFAARLTGWLYANAADALAAVAGPQAFARLPSEEEWEFAARGGVAVPEAVQRQRLFPMDGPLEDYVWFAGFKSCDGAVQPIGLLQPNPLGLHDILGNVQELTVDLYRLRTRARAHGQIGAATARGGSCLTAEARVRTAARDEVPLYDSETGQPAGKPFTGLRAAVGAPILIGQERIAKINDDWQAYGETRIQLPPGEDPVTILDRIAEAEDDAITRAALLDASRQFSAEMERRNTIEQESAATILRAGAMMIRDYMLETDNINRIEAVAAAESSAGAGDAGIDPAILTRARERLSLTSDTLLAALVHAGADFDAPTIEQASAIVQKENATRLQSATERTRDLADRTLRIFVESTEKYRARPDTDPSELHDAIIKYYDELRR